MMAEKIADDIKTARQSASSPARAASPSA